MDPIDDPAESSSSRDQMLGAVNLLEESWFFDNLFDRKTRMSRCNSEPCTPKFSQEMFVKDSAGQNSPPTADLASEDGLVRLNLLRTPSLPPCIGRAEKTPEKRTRNLTKKSPESYLLQTPSPSVSVERKEGKQVQVCKSEGEEPRRNLHRAPSLSPFIGREDLFADEESNNPETRKSSNSAFSQTKHKGISRSYSISRCRPPTSSEEIRRRFLSRKKSLSDLESEEVQGFRDLGFKFDREDLSPDVVSILPGLREKNQEDEEDVEKEKEKVRRPYLSEAWLVQTSLPPIPNWAATRSAEDMKAQIKFWARAVASNVHQEC